MEECGKLLLVEDDPEIRELLEHNLRKDGWNVAVAATGEAALLEVVDLHPDIILLDLMLPGVDGRDVCRQLRSHSKTCSIPIIMLSALSQEEDVIAGLELGADDYIPKPFSPELLRARIHTVLRRSNQRESAADDPPIKIHNLLIDPVRHVVKVDGHTTDLTPTDFMVLHMLASDAGRVFTRRQILEAEHGEECSVSNRSVDVQIVGLRRKIGRAGQLIETVRGIGYRMKEE